MKIKTYGKDNNIVGEREVPTQIFLFPSGDKWVAAWRHYDVMAQGDTRAEAIGRLKDSIFSQCFWDGIEERTPFSNTPRPPPEVLAEWERKHKEANPLEEG